MALFDNVNYTFYSDTLGRAVVPNEEVFNSFKTENMLYVKQLVNDDFIVEREENGIDSAICMMIEEDYKNSLIESGQTAVETSESIGGYSYSVSAKEYELNIEKNVKSLAEKKYKWLLLYCHILSGVK